MSEAKCPDISPINLNNPEIVYFEPTVLLRDDSKETLGVICPYLDPNEPICCNDDQVEIMNSNYVQIDSVFGNDCPVCAVNMKRMWCEYTCNPTKTRYGKKSVFD